MRVRLSVEKDENVLANSVYEILSGFDMERASRDILRRAIQAQTDQNFQLMEASEKFDFLWGAAIRINRP